MYLYAFILGRKPMLSIAELCSVIGEGGKIIDISTEALVATFDESLKIPQQSLNRLGGTIKIVRIFAEDAINKNEIGQLASKYLIDNFQKNSGKLIYGLSIYSFAEKHEIILRKTLNFIKKELKSANFKSRFINHNFKNPENAAIKAEKLLEKGSEIVAIQSARKIFIGCTVALQDFKSYSQRDYDRPARDPRLGMLPPKLAQIMINLGERTTLEKPVDPSLTLYDPFVGIGTVMTEGLFLGYNVIGSDIDSEVIQKTQKNVNWYRTERSEVRLQKNRLRLAGPTLNAAEAKVRLFVKDATTLTKKDLPENIDLVVTESYLGPPVSHFPPTQNMHKTFTNVRETVLKFFHSLHPLIKTGTPVIISLLVYKQQNRFFLIENLVGKIVDTGYKIVPLIPDQLRAGFNLKKQQRQSLIYDRPDQIVCREIWKFIRH